jgi:threonine dehydrogenase-like Zn-dependent dehydrogenase
MPAHDSMLHPIPDGISDELAVFADPFAVSLHGVLHHPPQPGSKALVYGAGALGSAAIAVLRALYPDVEVGVVARFEAQAQLARQLGAAKVFRHEPVHGLIEEIADWSGGILHGTHELPMAYPGGIDVVYDTISRKESLEVSVRVLKQHGHMVKLGVHGPCKWDWTPMYFKEISWTGSNAFGMETVEGVRKHAIEHYLDLVGAGRVDLGPMLTHTFGLDDWRSAFATLADQATSGAIKVAIDQRS